MTLDPVGHVPWPILRFEVTLPNKGDMLLVQGLIHTVGLAEGREVGRRDGFTVSLYDGRYVGILEGRSEGFPVGFIVGSLVG